MSLWRLMSRHHPHHISMAYQFCVMSPANETFNQTNRDLWAETDDCFLRDSTAVKMLRIVPYCILLVVSLLGNSVIIAVVRKEQRMRKTINFFIVNMCAADLLITLYMPRVMSIWHAGYEWQVYGTLGLILCKLAVFMHQTAICVSTLTVVAISCDRFCAVVLPMKTIISKKVCKIVITIIWIAAVAMRLPMLYGLKTGYDTYGQWSCFLSLDSELYEGAEKAYYQFTLFCLFVVPFLAIAVLYSGILITLKLRKVPGEEVSGNAGRQKRRDAMIKKRVLRMVLIVVAAFVLCWLLYFIQLILFSYKIQVDCDVLFLRLFLAHLNSALNPCLYLLLIENFREGLKNFLVQCPLCKLITGGRVTQRSSPSNEVALRRFQKNEKDQA